MFAAESPGPEELLFEAWGFVGYILKKLIFLRPCCQVVESYSTFGSFSGRCLLQREQVANFYGPWLALVLDVIQGSQRTEDSIPVCL